MTDQTEPTSDALKAAFLPVLQTELREQCVASDQTARDRKPVELDQQSVGRLSRMDAMQHQAMAAAQEARRSGRVWALEAAIKRIEAEEFGFCDSCGDFIGMPRLALDPTVMRCRDCAR